VKVGDMIKWVPHDEWDLGGRGIIIDMRKDEFRIAWLSDIEDFGLAEATDWKASWYDLEDFEESIEVVVSV
jgi:hypothetical protein